MKWFALALFVAPFAYGNDASPVFCERQLLPTSELISYLEALQESGLLGGERLALLHDQVTHDETLNPWAGEVATSGQQVHSQNFAQLGTRGSFDRAELATWVRQSLLKLGNTQVQRDEARSVTSDISMIFIRVPASNEVPPFEISINLAPEEFRYKIMGIQDNGWDPWPPPPPDVLAAMWFANEYSRLHGLPPYYLSPIKVIQGSEGDRFNGPLTTGSPYGYRLPTAAEWEQIEALGLSADFDGSDGDGFFLDPKVDHIQSVSLGPPGESHYVTSKFIRRREGIRMRLVRSLPPTEAIP